MLPSRHIPDLTGFKSVHAASFSNLTLQAYRYSINIPKVNVLPGHNFIGIDPSYHVSRDESPSFSLNSIGKKEVPIKQLPYGTYSRWDASLMNTILTSSSLESTVILYSSSLYALTTTSFSSPLH